MASATASFAQPRFGVDAPQLPETQAVNPLVALQKILSALTSKPAETARAEILSQLYELWVTLNYSSASAESLTVTNEVVAEIEQLLAPSPLVQALVEIFANMELSPENTSGQAYLDILFPYFYFALDNKAEMLNQEQLNQIYALLNSKQNSGVFTKRNIATIFVIALIVSALGVGAAIVSDIRSAEMGEVWDSKPQYSMYGFEAIGANEDIATPAK